MPQLAAGVLQLGRLLAYRSRLATTPPPHETSLALVSLTPLYRVLSERDVTVGSYEYSLPLTALYLEGKVYQPDLTEAKLKKHNQIGGILSNKSVEPGSVGGSDLGSCLLS